MKTILINYTGRHGGGNITAYEMTKELKELGYKLIVIISSNTDNKSDWINLNLYKLILIKTYDNSLEYVVQTLKFRYIERRKLKRQLINEKIDCIYCPMITLWSHMINHMFPKVPLIVVDHDPIPHSGFKSGFISKIARVNLAKKEADYVIVHSKCFIDYLEKRLNKKGRIIYIEMGRHNIYKSIKNKISIVSYSNATTNYLFFGTINKYKGLHILANAYLKLCEKYSNVTLTIAGSGDFSPYRDAYDKLPNVNIINRYIADEEIESLFQGDNLVIILPYIDATQSGVVLVAMDYLVPIIATRTGGLCEQIENNKTGILIKPSDSMQLFNAMEMFINNADLRNTLAKNVSDYVSTLDWEKSAAKLSNLINIL